MKWIEIAKAKPKFGQKYLVTNGKQATIAELSASKTTPSGVEHEFEGHIVDATHIATITLPNEKEVTNG